MTLEDQALEKVVVLTPEQKALAEAKATSIRNGPSQAVIDALDRENNKIMDLGVIFKPNLNLILDIVRQEQERELQILP
jgi:hypothetical protein